MPLLEGTPSQCNRVTAPSRLGWLTPTAFAVTVAALWLTQHPYAGFEHDARIYLFLALNALRPQSYSSDILVAYGSQGAYTIFPWIAGWAIELAGDAARGMFATWVASYSVFIFGVYFLCRALLPAPWWQLAMALVLVVPGDYGISGFLTYGEAIATPRPAAEGCVLLALGAWLSGSRRLAIAPLFLALLLHPLVAAPGVFVLLLMSLPQRFVWPAAGLALLGTLILFAVSSAAAPWPLIAMDNTWLAIVRDRAPYLFPDGWTTEDWGRVLVPIGWLALALKVLGNEDHASTLPRAALAIAVVGLLAAIATVVVPNVLFVQGQPWRWVWIAKLIAVTSFVLIGPRLWRAGDAGRSVAMLALAAWCTRDVGGAMLAVASPVLWAWRDAISTDSWRMLARISMAGLVLAVAWAVVRSGMGAWALYPFVTGATLAEWIRSMLRDGVIPVAGVVLVWSWAYRARSWIKPMIVAAATMSAAAPAAMACVETVSTTSRAEQYEPWRIEIDPYASLYWPGAPVKTWLYLERASYLSEVQATASLFNRGAAVELSRRAKFANALHQGGSVLSWADSAGKAYVYSAASLAATCADPRLDYLVVPDTRRLPGTEASDLPSRHAAIDGYRLLHCKDLRPGMEKQG